ncbi:taurine dioxygenase, 2-oxoglutarate-dependent domain protein [Escherichia coli 2-011-08_S3_C3]|nr:taurine dioxygenase, 2-oxoglutarate-dependent domain protein [Escherichia coli 2-011-08_S3_C3]
MDNEFQQWLSQINQVCGNFTGRLLTERYTGVLDTHFAKGLKLSTVTTSGVNLSRTWQEVKGSDDAWFYTVFQLSGQAIMEQDERQVQIGAGDITLLDASRPCLNRPGFPGECFICELRLPDHRFRWKHNKLFLLLPEEYGPAFPAIVDCYTSPPT